MLYQVEEYEGACSRAYYAMFHAARALLKSRGIGESSAKTHATILRVFSDNFVRGGPFDEDDGRALRQAGEIRSLADYDESGLGPERVRNVMASMEKFMAVAARVFAESAEGRS